MARKAQKGAFVFQPGGTRKRAVGRPSKASIAATTVGTAKKLGIEYKPIEGMEFKGFKEPILEEIERLPPAEPTPEAELQKQIAQLQADEQYARNLYLQTEDPRILSAIKKIESKRLRLENQKSKLEARQRKLAQKEEKEQLLKSYSKQLGAEPKEAEVVEGPAERYLKKKTTVYEPSQNTWLNFPSLAVPKKKHLTKTEYAGWLNERFEDETNRLAAQVYGEDWKDIDLDWREGWRVAKPTDPEIRTLRRSLDKYYANRKRNEGDAVKVPIDGVPYFKMHLEGALKANYGMKAKDIPDYVEMNPDDVKSLIKFEKDIRQAETKLYKAKRTGLFEKQVKWRDEKGVESYMTPQRKYELEVAQSETEVGKMKADFETLEKQYIALIDDTTKTIKEGKKVATGIAEGVAKTAVRVSVGLMALRGGVPKIVSNSLANTAADKQLNPLEQAKLVNEFRKTFKKMPSNLNKQQKAAYSAYALQVAEAKTDMMRDPEKTTGYQGKIDSAEITLKNFIKEEDWKPKREEAAKGAKGLTETEQDKLATELKKENINPDIFKQQYEHGGFSRLPPQQRLAKAIDASKKLSLAEESPSTLAETKKTVAKDKKTLKNDMANKSLVNKLKGLTPEQKETTLTTLKEKKISNNTLVESLAEVPKSLPIEQRIYYATAFAEEKTKAIRDPAKSVDARKELAKLRKEIATVQKEPSQKDKEQTKNIVKKELKPSGLKPKEIDIFADDAVEKQVYPEELKQAIETVKDRKFDTELERMSLVLKIADKKSQLRRDPTKALEIKEELRNLHIDAGTSETVKEIKEKLPKQMPSALKEDFARKLVKGRISPEPFTQYYNRISENIGVQIDDKFGERADAYLASLALDLAKATKKAKDTGNVTQSERTQQRLIRETLIKVIPKEDRRQYELMITNPEKAEKELQEEIKRLRKIKPKEVEENAELKEKLEQAEDKFKKAETTEKEESSKILEHKITDFATLKYEFTGEGKKPTGIKPTGTLEEAIEKRVQEWKEMKETAKREKEKSSRHLYRKKR